MSGRVRPACGSADVAGKAGPKPMRATLPVSSVLKTHGAGCATPGLRKSCGNSPTLSPTNAWRRVSPDHALSGQRSPGAVNYKGKGRYGVSTIRRTASLDTLYHKGQWPRDLYMHASQLQVDKATQTEEGGAWSGSGSGNASGRSSRASDEDKLDRFLRVRLQRTPYKASAEHSCQTTSFWTRYGTGGVVPLRAARSSVEGLNQEIERLVLFPATGTHTPQHDRLRDKQLTPEGHRAPFAEMLRRSVNTQTPLETSYTAHSSGPPSRASLSSAGSPELGTAGGSVCSSPDLDSSRLGTSPHINRFLAREPPDGCEKVNLKTKEWAGATWGAEARADPPCVSAPTAPSFQLRPSLTSAFQPLQPSDNR